MPSVIVNWNGQYRDLSTCKNLCTKLDEIAELSHSYFGTPTPLKYFNHSIEGKIILGDSLLSEDRANSLLCKVYEHPAEVDPLCGWQLNLAGPLRTKSVKVKESLFQIEKADLYGIEFRLFDGRHIYDDDDRVSFVFLRMEDCPELDGTLVYVEDRDQCQIYESDIIKEANWFLTSPHIHLRYYCEEWMDLLLGWTKHFYIPDLFYWRYEALPGYEMFSSADPHDLRARDVFFEALVESFKAEVAQWSARAAEVAAFWQNARQSIQSESE